MEQLQNAPGLQYKLRKAFQRAKLLTQSALQDVVAHEKILVRLLSIGVVLISIAHLVFLTKYPTVFIDESWYANAAWNWLKTGDNFETMHRGTLDQFGYEWIQWPVIGNIPWLVSFAILGLGLFQARLVAWIFGVLVLLATYFLGRHLYGRITGILAAFILSLSQPFLQASHYARYDIIISAVGLLGFLLALQAIQKDKWWLHLSAGLLIGLALDIHLNAILFALGLAAVYLVVYGSSVIRKKGVWLFAIGLLLGLVYYVVVRVMPSPSTYFKIYSMVLGNSHKMPLFTFNMLNLLKSVRDEIGRYHFFDNGLDFALIGASLAYLVVRRSKPDRLLVMLILTVFLGFVLLVGNKNDVYAILLYPFFILAVSGTMVGLMRAERGINPQYIFAGSLLLLLVFNNLVHFSRPLLSHRNYNYYSITEKIKTVIPTSSRVMGFPNWWLGLADYDYSSSFNLTFYHFINGYNLDQAMEKIHPDILIVDDALRGLLVDKGAYQSGAGFNLYRLPRKDFDDFLTSHGTKLMEFTDPWHGYFVIYKINWNVAHNYRGFP